ncbi:uncharacterized protein LOC126850601 [Cataglyphis hispanica]|uniref:uncharacterized protein LOC126850601 n=1 Tax=Cataglyphis hispanica TaxID=1086592 RepID=UPI00217FD7D5|nr:uncharacterized protein LOC126850601 [Cataglyphis hispanica]
MTSLKSDKNIKKLRLEELHALARRNFSRKRVVVRGYYDLWQADIVKMHLYARFNRGHHYIFTIINVLSKYTWAVSLKNKGRSETADAITEIIRDSKRYPRIMQTDMEKKFYNTDVQRLMKKHDIKHYSTYLVLKASIVERFNRTLICGRYLRSMELTSGRVVATESDHNARKHRTIGYVTRRRYPSDRQKTLGYTIEVFKIVKVQRTNPVTYLLEDYRGKSIVGAFYEYELRRANYPDVYLVEKVLRRRGDEAVVKWLT